MLRADLFQISRQLLGADSGHRRVACLLTYMVITVVARCVFKQPTLLTLPEWRPFGCTSGLKTIDKRRYGVVAMSTLGDAFQSTFSYTDDGAFSALMLLNAGQNNSLSQSYSIVACPKLSRSVLSLPRHPISQIFPTDELLARIWLHIWRTCRRFVPWNSTSRGTWNSYLQFRGSLSGSDYSGKQIPQTCEGTFWRSRSWRESSDFDIPQVCGKYNLIAPPAWLLFLNTYQRHHQGRIEFSCDKQKGIAMQLASRPFDSFLSQTTPFRSNRPYDWSKVRMKAHQSVCQTKPDFRVLWCLSS